MRLQILGVEDALEAGGHQTKRKTVLRPHSLAVHAIGDDAIVHRFGDGHARGALHFLGAFGDEPCRVAFQAALLEQRRKQHAGPFGAAGHPVRFLHGLLPAVVPVSRTLDEMQPGDGRKALQVRHGEGQGPIHQAVNHQSVLLGIDVRHVGAFGRRHIVERRWRDHADRILQRRGHVEHLPEHVGRRPAADRVRDAHRGHVFGALAVFDQLLGAHDHRIDGGCCRARTRCMVVFLCVDRYAQRQPAGQRGAALEEISAVSPFRIHQSFPRKMTRRRNHAPRTKV